MSDREKAAENLLRLRVSNCSLEVARLIGWADWHIEHEDYGSRAERIENSKEEWQLAGEWYRGGMKLLDQLHDPRVPIEEPL